MELDTFIKIGLPVSLGLIMLSMGMMLKTKDFQEVAKHPSAFFVGISAQMLLVPLLAILLLQIFKLPPLLAVALNMQLGENKEIIIPIGLTMKRLFIVTLLPVIVGMVWRLFKPLLADKIQPVIHRISVSLFLAVILSMILSQWQKMPEFLSQVGTIVSVMIVLAMLLGYYIAKITRLNARQVKTISIEVGMQNGGMALIVTQGVLHNPTMSIVPVIYGLIMLIPVILFVVIQRSSAKQLERA